MKVRAMGHGTDARAGAGRARLTGPLPRQAWETGEDDRQDTDPTPGHTGENDRQDADPTPGHMGENDRQDADPTGGHTGGCKADMPNGAPTPLGMPPFVLGMTHLPLRGARALAMAVVAAVALGAGAAWGQAALAVAESATTQAARGPAAGSATTPAATAATEPAATEPAATGLATTQAGAEGGTTTLKKVTVSAQLNEARDLIAPSLGAVTYTIGPEQIQCLPGGENTTIQQVLLRAPGVVEDSFGQQHIRGEHGNITYRVNGVLLPQPLEGFGQELDPRMAQSVTLIDGSLPAQFGFHTAGIVDVTTKSGATLQHNELSIYGGSFDTFQPSFEFGGTAGRLDYFVTGTYKHDDLGLENPALTYRALHDYTDQQKFFGYFSYTIDDTSRVSLLVNAANTDFQIPNTAGQPVNFALAGQTNTDSRLINENQNQQEYYTVVAYQKQFERMSLQISAFTRYADVGYQPDVGNDLAFQGVAGAVFNGYLTNGVQLDGSYLLTEEHTLRGGFILDNTCEKLDTGTFVFDVDPATGAQLSDVPREIDDDSANNAVEYGIYLQDEWKITPKLTLNYGARYDRFDANFDHEGQLSPRVNAVYKIDDKTTVHGGYARYFVPPPVQDVRLASILKYQNTTNAPENFADDAPRVERSNYYDLGISRQITKQWQVNVDGFYKDAKELIDEGQFGAPVILSPFNYAQGYIYGAELSTTYSYKGFSFFGNFSWVQAKGKDPNTQQYLWANDELAYAQTHYIALDHESEYTIASGASYTWRDDRVYIDVLMESGLRSGFANTAKEPVYYPVNIGWEHTFHMDSSGKHNIRWRVDVVNLFDEKYQIRSGSGIGVAAPQYGERLGFFTGITYEF